MPARFEIDVENGVVFSYATDPLSYTDLLRHQDRLIADHRFSPDFDHVADFRDLEPGTDITTDDVRDLARQKIYSSKSRRAFVAPNETLFGLARMFASLREIAGEPNVRVVKTLEDAAAWTTVEVTKVKDAFDRLRATAHSTKHARRV